MSDRTRDYHEKAAENANLWPDPVHENPHHFVDASHSGHDMDPDIGTYELEEPPIRRKAIVSNPHTGELVQLDHGESVAEHFHEVLSERRPGPRTEEHLIERTYER